MERREWHGKRKGRGEERKKKRKRKKRVHLARKRQDTNMGPTIWIYLQKCHCNFVSITQKQQNFVFIFTNSSLNLVIYEWWKQKMETHQKKPCMCGIHKFWVMSDEWLKTQNPNTPLVFKLYLLVYINNSITLTIIHSRKFK